MTECVTTDVRVCQIDSPSMHDLRWHYGDDCYALVDCAGSTIQLVLAVMLGNGEILIRQIVEVTPVFDVGSRYLQATVFDHFQSFQFMKRRRLVVMRSKNVERDDDSRVLSMRSYQFQYQRANLSHDYRECFAEDVSTTPIDQMIALSFPDFVDWKSKERRDLCGRLFAIVKEDRKCA